MEKDSNLNTHQDSILDFLVFPNTYRVGPLLFATHPLGLDSIGWDRLTSLTWFEQKLKYFERSKW